MSGGRGLTKGRRVAVVVGLCVGSAVGSALLTSTFTSSDRSLLEANSAMPSAVPYTAALGRLDDPVTGRVVGSVGRVLTLVAPSGDGPAVVTDMSVGPGDNIDAVQFVGAVRNRPVVAYSAVVGLWADVLPFESGPHIAGLQSALVASGATIAADEQSTGTFGNSTQRAVADIYRAAGMAVTRVPDPQNPAQVSGSEPPTGVKVPFGEFVGVGCPCTVGSTATVGALITDSPLATLELHSPTFEVAVGRGDVDRIEVGASVTGRDGSQTLGRVVSIRPATANGDGDGGETVVDGDAQSPDAAGPVLVVAIATGVGREVIEGPVRVETNFVSGDHVIVPLSALIEDGSTASGLIEVLESASPNARGRRVSVRIVDSRDGHAAIDSPQVRAGSVVNLNPR